MSAMQRTAYTAPSRPRIAIVPTDPVQTFLARLERVRKSGKGWTARCPAHEDKTASLSITAGDDGRVLLHCFAGCGAADVVAAAGLSVADLFVKRPTADMTFAERAALREYGKQAQWMAALNVLALESKIIAIAARTLRLGKSLDADDSARVVKACGLIEHAAEVLSNGRH